MNDLKLKRHLFLDCLCIELFKLPVYETSSLGKTVQNLEIKTNMLSWHKYLFMNSPYVDLL